MQENNYFTSKQPFTCFVLAYIQKNKPLNLNIRTYKLKTISGLSSVMYFHVELSNKVFSPSKPKFLASCQKNIFQARFDRQMIMKINNFNLFTFIIVLLGRKLSIGSKPKSFYCVFQCFLTFFNPAAFEAALTMDEFYLK